MKPLCPLRLNKLAHHIIFLFRRIFAMDAEKKIKIALIKLESEKTHRIDLLRALSKIDRNEFDRTLMELARKQKIELLGGDTSGMSDTQIEDLLKIKDTVFVNLTWLGALPAKARTKISLKKA